MNIWLMRMARWARNPPSPARMKLMAAVGVLGLAIWGIEAMGWWPEWAKTERIKRGF